MKKAELISLLSILDRRTAELSIFVTQLKEEIARVKLYSKYFDPSPELEVTEPPPWEDTQ
jgi:hypothetical protein